MELLTNLLELIRTPKPSISYTRPTQTRKIPPKSISYRGFTNSTKLHADELENKVFDYESYLEYLLVIALDHDFYCYDVQPQPLKVKFIREDGKQGVAYPDIWAIFTNDKQILYQVKPAKKLKELWNNTNWNLQVNAIEKKCKKLNWELKFVNEYELFTPRITNIKKLRYYALHHPEMNLLEDVINNLLVLYSNVSSNLSFTYRKLINSIHNRSKLGNTQIKSVVNWLLYYQVLLFDWQKVLSDQTDIYMNIQINERLTPFYQVLGIKPTVNTQSTIYLGYDPTEYYSDKQLEEAEVRYDAIKPLIEDKTPYNIATIKVRADQLSLSWMSLYRWIKKFEQQGINGLITKHEKKGNRTKKVDPVVNEIISKWIEEYPKDFQSISTLCETIKLECQSITSDHPIQIPSYSTIWNRVRHLKAKYRNGTQGGFIKHEVPQPINGNLDTAERPLDLIQIDHTRLDIILVDQFNRKPLGRPWLTLAIDTYSRMIFGYYLSFETPNRVKVTRTLLTGISPKDELLHKYGMTNYSYPIHGIPTILQVDNGLDFQSKHLKFFCIDNKIDLQFRMVKNPTKAAFVERFFETVRLSLVNLPGYTADIVTRRKHNYKPQKEAAKNGWTLFEFEKWFFLFVQKYHNNIHSQLRTTPLKQYEIGIVRELNTRPIRHSNLEKLKITILPTWDKSVSLSRYGIRWIYNNYNNETLINRWLKDQGKNKYSISFRYDPFDIRYIWVYDEQTLSYQQVPLTNGVLSKFMNDYDIPISYSEYEAVRKRLRAENTKVNVTSVSDELSKLLREYVKETSKKKPKKRITKQLESKLRNSGLTLDDLEISQDSQDAQNTKKKKQREYPKIIFDDDVEILSTSERRV